MPSTIRTRLRTSVGYFELNAPLLAWRNKTCRWNWLAVDVPLSLRALSRFELGLQTSETTAINTPAITKIVAGFANG